MAGPQVGDRSFEVCPLPAVWTGSVWAPVCPEDDTAMQNRPSDGVLACPDCGLSYPEAVDR